MCFTFPHSSMHNLLSVQNLARDEDCKVDFYSEFCIIHDKKSKRVLGVGKAMHGLYYLVDKPLSEIVDEWKKQGVKKEDRLQNSQENLVMNASGDSESASHHN